MILVDTNVAARFSQTTHHHHQFAVDSITQLMTRDGEDLVISAHSLYELYFVMTKPIASNGFGYTAQQASAVLLRIEGFFQRLPDSQGVYSTWKGLITKYSLVNRICFDAKLVAAMIENKIPRILTFNDADFKFFTEITTLNPFDVLGIPRV